MTTAIFLNLLLRTASWPPVSSKSTLKRLSQPCAASKAGNMRSLDWFAAGKLRAQQPPVCR